MERKKTIFEEVVIDPMAHIVSKTDKTGRIVYANEAFAGISGYTRAELEGKPHNIVRHPYMPKTIFKFMWSRLLKKQNFYAFVKNLTKDGKFYWVVTDFEVKCDDRGEIEFIYAYRKAAPKKGVEEVSKLYQKLVALEERYGMHEAEEFFLKYLKDNKMNYNEYVDYLLGNSSMFKSWFTSLKKIK